MRRPLILALALLILLPSAAFTQVPVLKIIAVNFPAFDFSRQIAGDRAQVSMLLPPGAEAHSYEPGPRDILAIQQADLLIYNGGIADVWVSRILASLGAQAPQTLRMMDSVQAVEEELAEGMEDEGHGPGSLEAPDGKEAPRDLDEHVWTSPRNAMEIAADIARALTRLDPAAEVYYQTRLAAYLEQLEGLDRDFRDLVAGAKRRTIVLGDRFPMRYFTMEYGLDYYAAFPGCSAQTEPSARTLAFLIGKIRAEGIPVVFQIEFSSGKSARVIAEETGAKPLLLHSAHNVSRAEMDGGATYLSLMRGNLLTLREALY